jgi:hypothetical protein
MDLRSSRAASTVKMFTHTRVFMIAERTLSIALLTIGVGVNSTWAGLNQTSELKFTPILTDVVVQPVPTRPGHPSTSFAKLRSAGSSPTTTFTAHRTHATITAEITDYCPAGDNLKPGALAVGGAVCCWSGKAHYDESMQFICS